MRLYWSETLENRNGTHFYAVHFESFLFVKDKFYQDHGEAIGKIVTKA